MSFRIGACDNKNHGLTREANFSFFLIFLIRRLSSLREQRNRRRRRILRFATQNRMKIRRRQQISLLPDLIMATTEQIIAPAGFWPRGQNPRRHNRTPREDKARKKNCSYQKKSRFRVIQPAKDLWDCPQAARKGSMGLPASRKVCPKGFLCLGHFSPRLDVICVGVSSGLSFLIDHAKWNIGSSQPLF